MSARSRQSHQLAAELSAHFGVRVELIYYGQPDRRGNGAWRGSWNDGPTVPTMTTQIVQWAGRFPAVDVERLGWSRSGTDLARATALVDWLPRHPERFDYLGDTFVVDKAFDETEFPERLDGTVRERARGLLRLDHGRISAQTVHLLGEHCVRSWEHAAQWLDGLAALAAGRAGDNVVDLAAARGRREQP